MAGERLPHDAACKEAFSHPRLMKSLLRTFAPPNILARLDLSTLAPYKSEFVARDNSQRRCDLVWQASLVDGRMMYFLILLEFQSTVDYWMALRVREYAGLLAREATKGKPSGGKAPLILPIVLYTGKGAWNAPLRYIDHLPKMDDYRYVNGDEYLLVDVNTLAAASLDGNPELAYLLLSAFKPEDYDGAGPVLKKMAEMLPPGEDTDLQRAIINLFCRVMFAEISESEKIIHCSTLQEVYDMLAERVGLWNRKAVAEGIAIGEERGIAIGREQGIAIGEERGIVIGEARSLKNLVLKMLADHFGHVSPVWENAVQQIDDPAILEKLSLAIYKLNSPEEFGRMLK